MFSFGENVRDNFSCGIKNVSQSWTNDVNMPDGREKGEQNEVLVCIAVTLILVMVDPRFDRRVIRQLSVKDYVGITPEAKRINAFGPESGDALG